jgi:hypothetical protein
VIDFSLALILGCAFRDSVHGRFGEPQPCRCQSSALREGEEKSNYRQTFLKFRRPERQHIKRGAYGGLDGGHALDTGNFLLEFDVVTNSSNENHFQAYRIILVLCAIE